MEKNKLKLDYCASGFCASFRMATPFKDFELGIVENLITSSRYLKDKLGGKVDISGLFNAFTEELSANRVHDTGLDFKDLFPDGIYADSGGLQVLTRGKFIDQAMKLKIYAIQAKYANFAMSFDEMPFRMVDGQKIYLPDTVGICGIRAGENLKEQIEFFEKIKANTKIFPIVQGLGLEDMRKYTMNMLGVLDESQLLKLECLAVGGIQSEFELLERSVNIYKIDGIPSKIRQHFHVLGVTGFRKLMPILIGARNGLLPGIKRLSFDSTTMTKSYLLGTIQPSLKDIVSGTQRRSLGKKRDAFVEDYYQQMWDFWKDNPANVFASVEDLIEHSCFNSRGLTTAAQQYKKIGPEHGIKTITQKHVYVFYNTFKFIEILEAYIEGKLDIATFMPSYKQLSLIQALEKISDVSDFDKWYVEVRKMAKVDKQSADDGSVATELLF